MADNIASAAISGDRNQGFKLAYNSGRVDVNYYIAQSGMFYNKPLLETVLIYWSGLSAQESKPRPCATVLFRLDNDFVYRDTLAEIHARCAQPAARVALVGLGGVG